MENKLFMRSEEVAKELGVSRAYAYKLITSNMTPPLNVFYLYCSAYKQDYLS